MELKLNRKNDSDVFSLHEGDVPFLSFRALDDTGIFMNAFSTRFGGVSEGYLASMNLTLSKEGEKPEHVAENFRCMAEACGFDDSRKKLSFQGHTVNVRAIGNEDIRNGILKSDWDGYVDGMVTDVPGLTLVTFFADCVPLYIADPVRKAIGLCHSGWRGTVGRIGALALLRMKELYGTKPSDVICCIGPSICRDCFEVGPEVADAFREAFPESWHREIIFGPAVDTSGNEKYHVDLWRTNELIFRDAGVMEGNIYTTNVCTRCNTEVFWSHRALGTRRGNMAAFLSIKE